MRRWRSISVLVVAVGLNALVWTLALATGVHGLPMRRVIAEFLSTSAIVLMSANAVISTRPFWLDRLYGGLDKLWVAHRNNGIAVALAIAGHFVLMPESPDWVPPKLIAYPNITLILLSVALAIAPRSPWRRFVTLRYDRWKLEHRFMGLFLAAALAHSLLAHPIAYALLPTRIWVLGVCTLGLLAYAYRELAENLVRERHRYTVAATSRPAADVLEVALAPVRSPITHRAGQFAFVRFSAGPSGEQHPFTLSAAPAADGALRFTIKASGDWTKALQSSGLPTGSEARIEGAYGGFDLRRGAARQVWIAGGIGITPFLAFLGEADIDRDVLLSWTVRTRDDAVDLAEVQAAIERHPSVELALHVSSEAGRLAFGDLGLERPSELSAFICGPVPMRDAFVTQLRAAGVADRAIFYEEFSLR